MFLVQKDVSGQAMPCFRREATTLLPSPLSQPGPVDGSKVGTIREVRQQRWGQAPCCRLAGREGACTRSCLLRWHHGRRGNDLYHREAREFPGVSCCRGCHDSSRRHRYLPSMVCWESMRKENLQSEPQTMLGLDGSRLESLRSSLFHQRVPARQKRTGQVGHEIPGDSRIHDRQGVGCRARLCSTPAGNVPEDETSESSRSPAITGAALEAA